MQKSGAIPAFYHILGVVPNLAGLGERKSKSRQPEERGRNDVEYGDSDGQSGLHRSDSEC
jgi:hypothetical protein